MTSIRKITFIGGIHGVGKSSICQNICEELNIQYLSASELIKWNEINEDSKNKKVVDIPSTQDLLLMGLRRTVGNENYYLLDGHYCLLDYNNNIVNVPLQTFKQINPRLLIIILDDVEKIKKRLETRDRKPYDYGLLESLQNEELSYAEYLSKTLRVKLLKGSKGNYSTITNSLRKILFEHA